LDYYAALFYRFQPVKPGNGRFRREEESFEKSTILVSKKEQFDMVSFVYCIIFIVFGFLGLGTI